MKATPTGYIPPHPSLSALQSFGCRALCVHGSGFRVWACAFGLNYIQGLPG